MNTKERGNTTTAALTLLLMIFVVLSGGLLMKIQKLQQLQQEIQLSIGITDKVMVVSADNPTPSSDNPGYTYKAASSDSDDYLGRMLVVLPTTTVEPKIVTPGVWVDVANNSIWNWEDIVLIGNTDAMIEVIISVKYDASKKMFIHDIFQCRSVKINGSWNSTWMGAQFSCLPTH